MSKRWFVKKRTEIISEMLDNPDENGIYPTTECFKELDRLFAKTKRIYLILIFVLLSALLVSSAFSQDVKELSFIGSKEDNKITVTTSELSFFSASFFKVGKANIRARLRNISTSEGKMQITWRIPSVVNGKLVFTVNDKAWRETIGVVDCQLVLIGKKVLRVVPAQAEKLVEEKK